MISCTDREKEIAARGGGLRGDKEEETEMLSH